MGQYSLTLKLWLISCFSLFCIYLLIKFIEFITGILWVKEIKKKHLLIRRNKKFNKKYGNKVLYSEFREIINAANFKELAERPAWFELFDNEKIVFFEIPWGEVYCECNNAQYSVLVRDIENKFVQAENWKNGGNAKVYI